MSNAAKLPRSNRITADFELPPMISSSSLDYLGKEWAVVEPLEKTPQQQYRPVGVFRYETFVPALSLCDVLFTAIEDFASSAGCYNGGNLPVSPRIL